MHVLHKLCLPSGLTQTWTLVSPFSGSVFWGDAPAGDAVSIFKLDFLNLMCNTCARVFANRLSLLQQGPPKQQLNPNSAWGGDVARVPAPAGVFAAAVSEMIGGRQATTNINASLTYVASQI